MNEVTRIHLGRQPFTAAVDAHKELKAYIAAIQNYVKDQDVIDEVELRMAELLTERGIAGERVILASDIDYLKQQLGDPKDFSENNEDKSETDGEPTEQPSGDKRLFRDEQNSMIAGVAAGLSAYFGIDIALIRILFVVALVTGGWGILLYILLWIVIPPAKTGSDRLRMRGESVTLNNLKEVVDRADAKGVAKRAGRKIVPFINTIFGLFVKLLGLVFILGGLAILFGIVALAVYMAAHNWQLFQEAFFPVGVSEVILTVLVMALLGLLGVVAIVIGQAMDSRRWPLRGWVTGVIAGIFFFGFAAAGALVGDSIPRVRDRVLSRTHTTVRTVEPFQTAKVKGGEVGYQWEKSDKYEVVFHYIDDPDISNIKTTLDGTTLNIDESGFKADRHCTMLCMFPDYSLWIVVRSPQPPMDSGPIEPDDVDDINNVNEPIQPIVQ